MQTKLLLILFTLSLTGCASTAAEDKANSPEVTSINDAKEAEPTMICKREKVTGSRTKGKRICRITGDT